MDKSQVEQKEAVGSIWTPTFTYLFIIDTLIHISTSMLNVVSTKFADHIGASLTTIGVISSMFALTALLFRFIVGPVIERYNKKFVLINAILIFLISIIMVSFSESITVLIISRLLMGIGLAFSSTLILTNASNSLPVEKMGAGIGVLSLGTAVSSAIAPMIGLWLVGLIGYRMTFLSNAAIMVLILTILSLKQIKLNKRGIFSISLETVLSKEILIPTVVFFLLAMTNHLFNAFLVLYSELQGITAHIGYFFTISSITIILMRPVIGKLTDKVGLMWAVIPSLVLFSFGLFFLSYAKTLPAFLTVGFLSAFGFGCCQPAIFASTLKNIEKERRGAAISTSYIGIDLGTLLGPIIAGAIAEQLGYGSMWRIMIIPVLLTLLISLTFRQEFEPQKQLSHSE